MAHTSARWDTGSQIIITRVLAAPNHHAVLGIRPNATAAEMRAARGPRHAETAELNRRQDQGGETCPEGLPLGFGAAVELQPQQTLNPRQKPVGRTHHRCGWWVVGKGFSSVRGG